MSVEINVTNPSGVVTWITSGDTEHRIRDWDNADPVVSDEGPTGSGAVKVVCPTVYGYNQGPGGVEAVRINYRLSTETIAMHTEWIEIPSEPGPAPSPEFIIEGLEAGTSYDFSAQGRLP